QPAQLVGGLGLEDVAAVLAERGLDRRRAADVVLLVFEALVGGRLAFEEGGDEIADANAIVVLELGSAGDRLVVDEGAVTAVEVLDEEPRLDPQDLGVLPAHRGHGDDNLALRIATEHEALAVEGNPGSLVGSFEDLQQGHRHTSGGNFPTPVGRAGWSAMKIIDSIDEPSAL